MQSTLAKAIFRVGAAYRCPSLFEEYRRAKESEWLTPAELKELQLQRAILFLSFARKHSRYYRRMFDEYGFVPEDITNVDELERLPTIEKSDLVRFNSEIHTDYDFVRTFRAETSGTTGSALDFRKNERWDAINRAQMMRSYDWYGVKPWHKNGYLWGYNIGPRQIWKVRLLDALQNRFRIFSYGAEEIVNFADRLRNASYVAGYSSMIYEVAKAINARGIEGPPLKLVKGTSEMILDAYQPDVRRAFGMRMVSEYGAAEAGLIAFECPEGSMHVNVENIIVETDAEDAIIVTNLASYSFPVIRYRLGDTVRLTNDGCSCGRAHPIISDIVGRRGSTVQGESGRYPALTFYYVFKNLALEKSILLNYKAVQKIPGRVVVLVEGRANGRYEVDIREELAKYFNDDVTFEIHFQNQLDRTQRKMQYFESHLSDSSQSKRA